MELEEPPVLIFASGNISYLKNFEKTIAVAGTRNPSIYAHISTRNFCYEWGKAGFVIVSGLAIGIDLEAHIGALQANGKTIAILGGGIDKIYPKEHEEVAFDIKQKGLILSEICLGIRPTNQNFIFRNRIIAALAKYTFIVEAGVKSGTAHQIQYAQ